MNIMLGHAKQIVLSNLHNIHKLPNIFVLTYKQQNIVWRKNWWFHKVHFSTLMVDLTDSRRKWVKLFALKMVRSRCKIYYRLAGHDRRGPLIWWHKGSVSRKWIPLLIFKEHIPRPLKELTIIYQAFQMVQITFIFSIGK